MTYSPRTFGKVGAKQEELEALVNDHGSLILKGTPVRITTLGKLEKIDVSNEIQMDAIAGLLKEDLANGATGSIIPSGLLENITSGASLGDILWVSKTGDLTNVKPAIGVNGFLAGDFIIRIGVVAKNLDNPSNKDLLINIDIVGQL